MATHEDSSPDIYFDPEFIGDSVKVAVVTASWNYEITGKLKAGAREIFLKYLKEENVFFEDVPGSFELPLGAQFFADFKKVDAVVCLGCLIRGETPHFDYISQAVSLKIGDLNLKYNIPVIFGVLTTETLEQARERSGGRLGNKGAEAAIAALKMLEIKNKLQ